MSAITTHVLDTASGKPGAGIAVMLEKQVENERWEILGKGVTNSDGRVADLLADGTAFSAGHYRLIFETGPYFLLSKIECFFPRVTIGFVVRDTSQHYHVPLLVSPFGYSTYRGS